MMPTDSILEKRRSLHECPDCRFVDSQEFCELLVGFKRLVRSDEKELQLRGLLDLDTGVRYLIDQNHLNPPVASLSAASN